MWTVDEISRWRRNLEAMARSARDGDPEAFAALVRLSSWIYWDGVREAYEGLKTAGYSDADLGRALGITRQAVNQRFAKR